MAYSASGLAVVTGSRDRARDTLSYVTSCVEILRICISESGPDDTLLLETLIFRLLRAEVLSSNFQPAIIHAALLKRLLMARYKTRTLNLGTLTMVLYQGNNLALGLWKRPLFDPSWIEHVFSVGGKYHFSLRGEGVGSVNSELGLHIEDPRLHGLLAAMKTLFSHAIWMYSKGQVASPHNLFWLASYCEWLQSSLIDYYMDQENDRSVTFTHFTTELNVGMSLPAFHSLRYQHHEPWINGVPVSPVPVLLLQNLSPSYSRLEFSMNAEQAAQHEDALIWIVFVASLAENGNQSVLKRARPGEKWFDRLEKSIVRRRLSGREDLRCVLERWPRTEHELPLPVSHWLDDAFERSRDVQKILDSDETHLLALL